MFTLIILCAYLHAEPQFFRFDMPDREVCEMIAEDMLIELRGDRFVIDVDHWCVSLYAEL